MTIREPKEFDNLEREKERVDTGRQTFGATRHFGKGVNTTRRRRLSVACEMGALEDPGA